MDDTLLQVKVQKNKFIRLEYQGLFVLCLLVKMTE